MVGERQERGARDRDREHREAAVEVPDRKLLGRHLLGEASSAPASRTNRRAGSPAGSGWRRSCRAEGVPSRTPRSTETRSAPELSARRTRASARGASAGETGASISAPSETVADRSSADRTISGERRIVTVLPRSKNGYRNKTPVYALRTSCQAGEIPHWLCLKDAGGVRGLPRRAPARATKGPFSMRSKRRGVGARRRSRCSATLPFLHRPAEFRDAGDPCVPSESRGLRKRRCRGDLRRGQSRLLPARLLRREILSGGSATRRPSRPARADSSRPTATC